MNSITLFLRRDNDGRFNKRRVANSIRNPEHNLPITSKRKQRTKTRKQNAETGVKVMTEVKKLEKIIAGLSKALEETRKDYRKLNNEFNNLSLNYDYLYRKYRRIKDEQVKRFG